MNIEELQEITWLEPWFPISSDSSSTAETELRRECAVNHPLYGLKVKVIARRADCDDYLSFLPYNPLPLAVVHLTFQREESAEFPHTIFYSSLNEWIEKDMKVSHQYYIEDTGEKN
jgi:hypothetical protein